MSNYEDFINLSELILSNSRNREDAVRFASQRLLKLAKIQPELQDRILKILRKSQGSNVTKSVRFARKPLPVDQDSRLELIKTTVNPKVTTSTRWPIQVQSVLEEVIEERTFEQQLIEAGLDPITSLLFVGPPGVGKTMAASWLALALDKPFYVLDLSAVMSSYLGRTGSNIRTVLDFAKSQSAVLLLDEFDAIAKRRDDNSEIGELKRLVTVLLQEIENWPNDGLLIAATNHEELLDPAVWRRFNKTITFPNPSYEDLLKFLENALADRISDASIIPLLGMVFLGHTYATVDKELNALRKKSVLTNKALEELLSQHIENYITAFDNKDKNEKRFMAKNLLTAGISQRQVSRITGISRPTLKNMISE